jgi:hypothetical protein
MNEPTPRPELSRFLNGLALGHFANAVLTGLAGAGVALHPHFRQSERLEVLGAFLALTCVLLALADGWTGLCLRRRQARGFCMVVAAINCLCLPGVLVGLPTLAALSRPGVASLFTRAGEP